MYWDEHMQPFLRENFDLDGALTPRIATSFVSRPPPSATLARKLGSRSDVLLPAKCQSVCLARACSVRLMADSGRRPRFGHAQRTTCVLGTPGTPPVGACSCHSGVRPWAQIWLCALKRARCKARALAAQRAAKRLKSCR